MDRCLPLRWHICLWNGRISELVYSQFTSVEMYKHICDVDWLCGLQLGLGPRNFD